MRGDAMADIDIDVPSENRDTVKEYIKNRFGRRHTCSIGTYGKLQLRAGIKDFSKIKGLDFSYANYVTKDIDNQVSYEWVDLIKYAVQKGDMYKFVQNNDDIVHLIKFCIKQPRAYSVHASAVIIVPKVDEDGNEVDIYDWLPLRLTKGMLVSEWEGKYTDKAGFLKEDILGLTQLDKFMSMNRLIKQNHGKTIKLHKIDLEDRKTYRIYHRGMNEDVFQMNGRGLKKYSTMVKPDSIEDLTAMNALWRPGAMESNAHLDFADIKHGKKKPKYDFGLKEITKNTLGLLVYQEQIMQSFVAAGMTLVEADTARTAIKKFDDKLMSSFEDKFKQGLIDKGCDKFEAEKIWKKILAFAGYSFNKSHASAYALISYWSQWFKANYPLEFWTTSLQFVHKEIEIVSRISEIKKLKQGIDLKPPSINVSGFNFECDKNTQSIYWSFVRIKGIGEATAKAIIDEREANGEFDSYDNFIERVPKSDVNKAHIANLILAGAFDEVEGIDNPIKRKKLLKKHFAVNDTDLPEIYTSSQSKKPYFWIFQQKMLTGYGSVDYKELLYNTGNDKLAKIYKNAERFFKANDYEVVCICGVFNYINVRETKTGKQYGVLEILSNNDLLIVMMWEETLLKYIEDINSMRGKVIAINGKAKFDEWKGHTVLHTNEDTQIREL